MIDSLILRTAVRALFSLVLLFSLFITLRGHNQVGGGFAGGLIAAAAFSLLSFSERAGSVARLVPWGPRRLSVVGLALIATSALLPLAAGNAVLEGLWLSLHVGGGEPLHLGTPLLFDLGVYALVTGAVLTVLVALERDEGML